MARQNCSLLAVLCGKFADKQRGEAKLQSSYPFPELISSGRLEVHVLVNPSFEKFSEAQRLVQPNFLYCQGERLENEEEIGSLMWGTDDASDPQTFSSLISPPLPTIVYLEVPNSEKIAQTLHYKGVPYIIYWKNAFTAYAASHFHQALLSVVQSSCSHAWDTFQLALASFRLYCVQSNHALPDNSQKSSSKIGPQLLGDIPKINIAPPEKEMVEEEDSSESSPAIKIYDEDVDLRFLVCGVPCTLDASLLGSLEDGLNALLNIEIRGCKLQNRVSAAPPPLQAGSFTRGVVTMRCDITTCSSAHISLLVSGSVQTCFDDQPMKLLLHSVRVLVSSHYLLLLLAYYSGGGRDTIDRSFLMSTDCSRDVLDIALPGNDLVRENSSFSEYIASNGLHYKFDDESSFEKPIVAYPLNM